MSTWIGNTFRNRVKNQTSNRTRLYVGNQVPLAVKVAANATGRSKGFSLLEVLVAASISSIGLGGITALLLVSGVRTTQSLHESRASLLASDAIEILALAGSGEFLQTGLSAWQARVATELPEGQGLSCRDASPDDGHAGDAACDGGGLTVVKLFWTEQDQPRRLVLESES